VNGTGDLLLWVTIPFRERRNTLVASFFILHTYFWWLVFDFTSYSQKPEVFYDHVIYAFSPLYFVYTKAKTEM